MLENQILQFQFSGIDSIILTIGQIMLFILGGYLVLSQKLSVGEFSVINLYFHLSLQLFDIFIQSAHLFRICEFHLIEFMNS